MSMVDQRVLIKLLKVCLGFESALRDLNMTVQLNQNSFFYTLSTLCVYTYTSKFEIYSQIKDQRINSMQYTITENLIQNVYQAVVYCNNPEIIYGKL